MNAQKTTASRIFLSLGRKPGEHHQKVISDFVNSNNIFLIFAFVQKDQLVVTTKFPLDDGSIKRIFYSFKNPGTSILNESNIFNETHIGVFRTPFISAISQLVEKLYGPMFHDACFCPDSVRNDLNSRGVLFTKNDPIKHF